MYRELSHEEYLKLSERTMGTNFYLNNQSLINLLHSAIGIQTEIAELFEACLEFEPEYIKEDIDSVNITEETGDIAWYLAIIHREMDIGYSSLKMHSPYQDSEEYLYVLEKMNISSGNLLDMVKKKAFYNKPLAIDQIKIYMADIYSCLHWFMSTFTDKTLSEALAININKLQSRFPDKFTTEDANNRDLEKERAILEGNVKSEEMGMGYL